MTYYVKMLTLLWGLPKLRPQDIKDLAARVEQMRISDEDVQEYVRHVKSYI